ncbi:MAG: ABC transporter ATP-binding protein [Saprospiraceae bacterium]
MAILELVGIASIFPFMQLVAEPDAITENAWLKWAYERFGFETPRAMLISTGFMVIGLLAISKGVALFTSWWQHKYSWDVAHQLCIRLLDNYLNRPYSYFLTKNTSELFSNLILEVSQFTASVLIPLLELLSQAMIIVLIFFMLLVVNTKIALLVSLVLGASYGLVYFGRRHFLSRMGEERIDVNLRRFKSMNEALTSIKTSSVYGAKGFFFKRFEEASREHASIHPKVHLIVSAPKYMIEVLAFGSILGIVVFLLMQGQDLQAILPLLSLYALAGYRLLPALQRVFSAAATVQHAYPVVQKLYVDLRVKPNTNLEGTVTSALAPFSQSLQLKNITFYYEGTTQAVLSNVKVLVPKGETIAFVGTTGSGKTTLVDLIVGLLYTQEGQILIDGVPLEPGNAASWQQQIGYVSQDVFLFDDSIKRNLAIGVQDEHIDMERMEKAAQIANIHTFITTELPEGYETIVGERGVRLSGGQRQRLGLARALYRNPSVLVLDEATSALDGITEQAVIESIKKIASDLTIIIIAHRLSTVRHADCIYVLEAGKITEHGSYDSLLETSVLFREMAQFPEAN